MSYDVAIVGGGPAGLSCATTLLAAQGMKGLPDSMRVLVVDDGRSDLLAAELHSSPGYPAGTTGDVVLQDMQNQFLAFSGATLVNGTVKRIDASANGFVLAGSNGERWEATRLVFACGYKEWRVSFDDVLFVPHQHTPKARQRLVHDGFGRVKNNVYVAGVLAGVPSMFVTAAGSGTQAACLLLSDLCGQPVVVHDVPGSRSRI